MSRLLCSLVAFTFAIATAQAQEECSIVYGKTWAFAFLTPAKWSSLCGAEQPAGVPAAFWPAGSTFEDSVAVMYVNVSINDEPSLEKFVQFSQRQFRRKAPKVAFVRLKPIEGMPKLRVLHFSASGDPGGNVEQLAYVKGPTAYFILVLSARNPKALEQARPAFLELLRSFSPMAATARK